MMTMMMMLTTMMTLTDDDDYADEVDAADDDDDDNGVDEIKSHLSDECRRQKTFPSLLQMRCRIAHVCSS